MKKKNVLIVTLLFVFLLSTMISCGSSSPNGVPYENNISDNKSGVGNIDNSNESTVDSGNDAKKIVYYGTVDLQTQKYEECIAAIQKSVTDFNGYISNSKIGGSRLDYDNGSLRSAYFEIRIPSERMTEYLGGMNNYGHVYNQSTGTDDVTASYYDVSAEIKSLEAYEEKLNELYKEADKSMALDIFREIQETRTQIDKLKSSIALWDNLVEYSTIKINVQEVSTFTEVGGNPITLGEKITESFNDQMRNISESFQNFIVWLAGSFIGIILWSVIIAALIVVVYRLIKKQKRKEKELLQKYCETFEKKDK